MAERELCLTRLHSYLFDGNVNATLNIFEVTVSSKFLPGGKGKEEDPPTDWKFTKNSPTKIKIPCTKYKNLAPFTQEAGSQLHFAAVYIKNWPLYPHSKKDSAEIWFSPLGLSCYSNCMLK